jgi:hypothetical protein
MIATLRRLTLLFCLLLVTGCTQAPATGVAPGDGPAATASESELDCDNATTEAEQEECADLEPDGPTEEAEPMVASFKEKYTWDDGVQVEVIKIRHAKISKQDAEFNQKLGQDYVVFTIRVRNNSKRTLNLIGVPDVAYGPDGEPAEAPVVSESLGDMSGKLIPGKARSAGWPFFIPPKYQDDVVMEFSIGDGEHESAVFSGSVK